MNKLTHLHLFNIVPHQWNYLGRDSIHLPGLNYLALHFHPSYFSGRCIYGPFPNWRLERLNCLSMAGGTIMPALDEILGTYFERLSCSGGNPVSELLLDFRWKKKLHTKVLWERIWLEWFPCLTVLGCRSESLRAITLSLLGISSHTAHWRRISLFLLDNDVFGAPRIQEIEDQAFSAVHEAYRAGHLERIYIPTSDPQSSFVRTLVRYCNGHKIPVYDTEGWQVYQVSLA
jgi:hypothetical protein